MSCWKNVVHNQTNAICSEVCGATNAAFCSTNRSLSGCRNLRCREFAESVNGRSKRRKDVTLSDGFGRNILRRIHLFCSMREGAAQLFPSHKSCIFGVAAKRWNGKISYACNRYCKHSQYYR